MDATTGALAALLDRDAIRQAIVRLARGEDRRDAALIASAWWPDATTDYGVFKGDFDAYLAWVVPGHGAIADTQHVLGQSLIELNGVHARVETHVIACHRIDTGTGDHDTCIGGRYLDRFEGRDHDWRIVERTMLYDWSQDWGTAADWSQGLVGTPFSAAHFAGRAVGDHSSTFFAPEPTRS